MSGLSGSRGGVGFGIRASSLCASAGTGFTGFEGGTSAGGAGAGVAEADSDLPARGRGRSCEGADCSDCSDCSSAE